MKRHDLRLESAKQASDNQRVRLQQRLSATRVRLLPSRLKFDATQAIEQRISNVAHVGVDQVKAHPVLAGVGFAAALGWLFRGPLIEHGPDTAGIGWNWLAGKLGLSQSDIIGADIGSAEDTDVQQTPPAAPSSGAQED